MRSALEKSEKKRFVVTVGSKSCIFVVDDVCECSVQIQGNDVFVTRNGERFKQLRLRSIDERPTESGF